MGAGSSACRLLCAVGTGLSWGSEPRSQQRLARGGGSFRHPLHQRARAGRLTCSPGRQRHHASRSSRRVHRALTAGCGYHLTMPATGSNSSIGSKQQLPRWQASLDPATFGWPCGPARAAALTAAANHIGQRWPASEDATRPITKRHQNTPSHLANASLRFVFSIDQAAIKLHGGSEGCRICRYYAPIPFERGFHLVAG